MDLRSKPATIHPQQISRHTKLCSYVHPTDRPVNLQTTASRNITQQPQHPLLRHGPNPGPALTVQNSHPIRIPTHPPSLNLATCVKFEITPFLLRSGDQLCSRNQVYILYHQTPTSEHHTSPSPVNNSLFAVLLCIRGHSSPPCSTCIYAAPAANAHKVSPLRSESVCSGPIPPSAYQCAPIHASSSRTRA